MIWHPVLLDALFCTIVFIGNKRFLIYGIHNPVSESHSMGFDFGDKKYPFPAFLLVIFCFSISESICFSSVLSDKWNAILISAGATETYLEMKFKTAFSLDSILFSFISPELKWFMTAVKLE